jgi:hypothetical protein
MQVSFENITIGLCSNGPYSIQQAVFAKIHHLIPSSRSTAAFELHQLSMQRCAIYGTQGGASAVPPEAGSEIELVKASFLLMRAGYQTAAVILNVKQ